MPQTANWLTRPGELKILQEVGLGLPAISGDYRITSHGERHPFAPSLSEDSRDAEWFVPVRKLQLTQPLTPAVGRGHQTFDEFGRNLRAPMNEG